MSFYLTVMEEKIYQDVCRACMTENGDFQSVFMLVESTGLNIHLAEMFMAFASVQITQGDGLPEQICTKCVIKASEFYLFKLKCEETDRILRSKFGEPPYSIIDDHTDVIIKSEICAGDFEVTDHCIEYEDNKLKNKLPKKEVIEIEEKIFFECDKVNQSNGEFQSNETIKDHQEKIEHVDLKSKLDLKSNAREGSDSEDLAVHRKSDDLTCLMICNKKFTKRSHLKSHMAVAHSDVKPYNCNLCKKGFGRAKQLSLHMNTHSGIEPHVCKTCSKGFNEISNLKEHMLIHKGENKYLCSTCGKGFNHLGNLRQHSVRHSVVKAHLCNTCGSGFASKGDLSVHLRKHTGARPFVCSECNKGFITSSSLTIHKRIHSGEKPYECEVCKMKFSRSSVLARHKRTHTGEKPRNP